MVQQKQAFTLIELLVVVLIIGILAAVALSQYKIAVAKSRTSTILPLLRSLATSQEVYYLANGFYGNAMLLDIEFPKDCTPIRNGYDYQCGNYFYIVNDGNIGQIRANYCPGNTDNETKCINTREFQIRINFKYSQAVQNGENLGFRCAPLNSFGRTICKQLAALMVNQG